MSELDDLQQLWQSQASAQDIPEPEQALSAIHQFHQRVRRERKGMTISFIFTFIFLSATFWIIHSPLYVIGIFTIFGTMAFLMDLMWRNNLKNNGSGFELSNQDFLNANIDFIQKRRALTARSMPIYALLLILGLNIGYIDILKLMELPLWGNLGIHLGLSLAMIIAFYFGIKTHLKKFDQKLAPLVESLKKLRQIREAE